MTWSDISSAPEELKDGRSLILANYGDTEGWPGYWERRPNHWDEIGWAEEDARDGLYYTRHPAKPDLYMLFPPPPKETDT